VGFIARPRYSRWAL